MPFVVALAVDRRFLVAGDDFILIFLDDNDTTSAFFVVHHGDFAVLLLLGEKMIRGRCFLCNDDSGFILFIICEIDGKWMDYKNNG